MTKTPTGSTTKMALPPADEWEIDNLPNRLTIFRISLIPVIIGLLMAASSELNWEWAKQHHIGFGYAAAWLFGLASITDFFDGHIARKRKLVTVFGSFLDPIADKFLVVSSLIMLLALGKVPALIVIVLVLREFYITALRLLAHEKGLTVPVANMAKWKTALQMFAIPFLMPGDDPWGLPMTLAGKIMMFATTILSVYSALEYSFGLVHKFRENRRKNLEEKKNKPPAR